MPKEDEEDKDEKDKEEKDDDDDESKVWLRLGSGGRHEGPDDTSRLVDHTETRAVHWTVVVVRLGIILAVFGALLVLVGECKKAWDNEIDDTNSENNMHHHIRDVGNAEEDDNDDNDFLVGGWK